MQLAGQDERQVAQAGEGEAAVSAGEAAPSVVEEAAVRLGAAVDCYVLVFWCAQSLFVSKLAF